MTFSHKFDLEAYLGLYNELHNESISNSKFSQRQQAMNEISMLFAVDLLSYPKLKYNWALHLKFLLVHLFHRINTIDIVSE